MAMGGNGLGSDQSLKSTSQPPSASDRRQVDKALKRLEKLHRLCTNPRLGLRNSPPYLPEVVSKTATLLTQVWEPYRGPGAGGQAPRGDEGEYLMIHARHLLDKTDRAVLLFKEGRDKMFEEMSSYRRNLTKLSLLFSHMLWELRAMFPEGRFQGDTYRLTKTEAGEFWRRAFGNNGAVLSSISVGSMALKRGIGVHGFKPWRSLLRNWNQLAVTHPGYMAFLTYDQVKTRLQNYLHRPGSYLYPDGRDVNPDLTSLCEPAQRSRVKVTEDEYEMYCEMGSTFQLGTESILVEPYLSVSEEEEEEDDLEDIQLVMKKLAYMKGMSSEEYQFPSSRLAPPLPPKHSTSSRCPSPQAPLRPSVPDTLAKYSHSNSRSAHSDTPSDRALTHHTTSTNSQESVSEPNLPSSSPQSCGEGGAAWVGASDSVKPKKRHKERGERTAELGFSQRERERTMSS
ncbi:unnamed protein product [Coregonus sp. 'balchen']|nr:unnamed protein product [Coregonus sp. 'balchen']